MENKFSAAVTVLLFSASIVLRWISGDATVYVFATCYIVYILYKWLRMCSQKM